MKHVSRLKPKFSKQEHALLWQMAVNVGNSQHCSTKVKNEIIFVATMLLLPLSVKPVNKKPIVSEMLMGGTGSKNTKTHVSAIPTGPQQFPKCPVLGLQNFGNTCFASAALQVLVQVDRLDGVNFSLDNPLVELMAAIKRKDQASIGGLLHSFLRTAQQEGSRFKIGNTWDAEDFLVYCLELPPNPDKAFEIHFNACYNSHSTCTACRAETNTPIFTRQALTRLCLPTQGSISLQELMALHRAQNQDLRTELACNNCPSKESTTTKLCLSTGNYVMLELKRIVSFDDGKTSRKVFTHVDFPLEGFDFGMYTAQQESSLFDLVAAIHHIGPSSQGGHYVADVYDPKEKQWWRMDDEHGNKISGPNWTYDDITTPTLLVYRRRDVKAPSGTQH
jgi:ubiquitin C-terminal hydrolase